MFARNFKEAIFKSIVATFLNDHPDFRLWTEANGYELGTKLIMRLDFPSGNYRCMAKVYDTFTFSRLPIDVFKEAIEQDVEIMYREIVNTPTRPPMTPYLLVEEVSDG
jgi:hypothetical protein